MAEAPPAADGIRDATLRTLEFPRIVEVVAGFAATPAGAERLHALAPATDPARVRAALAATSEGVQVLESHGALPLVAPNGVDEALDAVLGPGVILEPLALHALAAYLTSAGAAKALVAAAEGHFPTLRALAREVADFGPEAAAVRRAIDDAGEVVDGASPALAAVRERLRRQRASLRRSLEGFLQGREAKYLQDQVVTDRHGRYVLVVRAEHRDAIPGIVHGSSSSGASLYLEPMATVSINNDIVALEEQEAAEVRRILLALTEGFRNRGDDLRATVDATTGLDEIQARAAFSRLVGGVESTLDDNGGLVLDAARHPLLMGAVMARLDGAAGPRSPVPVDVRIEPPARVLVIAGPNTGGKTVALKTVGLLALMAQAGLHVPAAPDCRLPVFRSVFADIGDEQSIAASLSTFSAHVGNLVSMDRTLALPALILLDEVGAGTDPSEGGALGVAVIDHFRRRGAHLVATTHYDALKSYASATEGVIGAAFGFEPDTFAPTYRLLYGSPGRSLALEIAARLGMPPAVIAAARGNLTEPERQLAAHLERLDRELGAVAGERAALSAAQRALNEAERALAGREASVQEREQRARKRLDRGVDEQVRAARRRIDEVIDELKTRAAEMAEQSALAPRLNTGATGAARGAARAAIDEIARAAGEAVPGAPTATADPPAQSRPAGPPPALAPGVRVLVGALGLEGLVTALDGRQAEVAVHGKRLRVPARDLRPVAVDAGGAVRINVDLAPREGLLTELNVIGCTVHEALDRTGRFLDQSLVGDVRTLRLIHGHGTGQLRRALTAFLRDHPQVAHAGPAPGNQGGGGVTLVELKD
jgi:DNA mismatch repair protein MutS2